MRAGLTYAPPIPGSLNTPSVNEDAPVYFISQLDERGDL
jgi:hypothetical protein